MQPRIIFIAKCAFYGIYTLELVCCKKQQKKFLTSYWFVE